MLSNEDVVLLVILAAGALYMNWNTLRNDWIKVPRKTKKRDLRLDEPTESSLLGDRRRKPAEETA